VAQDTVAHGSAGVAQGSGGVTQGSGGVAQGFSPAFLYPPQTAYRLRRDNWPDTPLPPEFPAGQNPPAGAIIDYYLAGEAAAPIMLEIFKGTALVRRYASTDPPQPLDEKAFNVPMHWARPPQILSAVKGMHRFIWDLRYPAPGAVQRDFPISAISGDTPLEPLGVIAAPGAYVVKLTVAGRTYSRPLTLKMDPRASITPVGLTQQFTLATKIAGLMNRTFAAITAKAASSSPGASTSPQSSTPSPSEALAALNADLATAYDVVEGADRAPTTQALKAVTQLEQRVNALLKGTP
jgi:hypothetical protein